MSTTYAADRWATEFQHVSDDDAELSAHGRYFSCDYLLDMGERSYIVRVHRGKIEEIVVDPGPLEAYQFALRASADTWRKFSQDPPPPMFHGIWAASFREDMSLEGDLLVLMQNLRCLTRQLELLRVTGAPV
ncbi:hypothetical protein SAMN05216276_11004 [Streptosporangium subroseum]|uniref:SCP-2 sterol transfer family protein n=1 Tax=Streptosporangium subroseum TaxID=106412 RepID=A0A239P8E6_9ACTN|nr:hypothetical protein [Streptosporangium subroseum]SNT63350.1 hypothetical protein SAMN05216276_11004 [Streptosporangium subroseum]